MVAMVESSRENDEEVGRGGRSCTSRSSMPQSLDHRPLMISLQQYKPGTEHVGVPPEGNGNGGEYLE